MSEIVRGTDGLYYVADRNAAGGLDILHSRGICHAAAVDMKDNLDTHGTPTDDFDGIAEHCELRADRGGTL
jgi:hypothetical protein